MRKYFIFIVLLLLVLSGCKVKRQMQEAGMTMPYRKVLKSTDYDLKYDYANKYLEIGACSNALPLFEELILIYKLDKRAEDVYYKMAMCHYCLRDYYLAGYYFKNFARNNLSSDRAEDAFYMSALCKVRISPEFSLDPSDTRAAIEELQLFIDRYPQSPRVDSCNELVDDLQEKMERKYYEIAKQYYKTRYYKSSAVAFDVLMEKFPATQFREEAMYMICKSYYLLAENSIESKKIERYELTKESYANFRGAYPESKWLKELEAYNRKSEIRIEELNDKYMFWEVRDAYRKAESVAKDEKRKYYSATVESYLKFVAAFPESRWMNDATDFYERAQEGLAELNENKENELE